jgi:hypothetical protein
VHIVWVGYVLAFALFEPSINVSALDAYLRFFQPLVDLMAPIALIIRDHSESLTQHGYELRARVVAHVYSVNLAMFFVALGVDFYRAAMMRIYLYPQIMRESLKGFAARMVPRSGWVPFRLFLLGAAMYVFGALGLGGITYGRATRYSWDIATSNSPFLLHVLLFEAVLGVFLYSHALATWITLDRRHPDAFATKPADGKVSVERT